MKDEIFGPQTSSFVSANMKTTAAESASRNQIDITATAYDQRDVGGLQESQSNSL
jgi:hypothetical protein